MRPLPGLDLKLPRSIEAMMRAGDRKGAVQAVQQGCEVSRAFADGVLRLWCLRQSQLEAAAVLRALQAPLADDRQLVLFSAVDGSVRGCG